MIFSSKSNNKFHASSEVRYENGSQINLESSINPRGSPPLLRFFLCFVLVAIFLVGLSIPKITEKKSDIFRGISLKFFYQPWTLAP